MRNGLTRKYENPPGIPAVRRGEDHPEALLTNAQVRHIRLWHQNGVEAGEIKALMGINQWTYAGIILGRTYKDA